MKVHLRIENEHFRRQNERIFKEFQAISSIQVIPQMNHKAYASMIPPLGPEYLGLYGGLEHLFSGATIYICGIQYLARAHIHAARTSRAGSIIPFAKNLVLTAAVFDPISLVRMRLFRSRMPRIGETCISINV